MFGVFAADSELVIWRFDYLFFLACVAAVVLVPKNKKGQILIVYENIKC